MKFFCRSQCQCNGSKCWIGSSAGYKSAGTCNEKIGMLMHLPVRIHDGVAGIGAHFCCAHDMPCPGIIFYLSHFGYTAQVVVCGVAVEPACSSFTGCFLFGILAILFTEDCFYVPGCSATIGVRCVTPFSVR